ncbi:MAG: ATP-binding protein [Nitratireductor sp.]
MKAGTLSRRLFLLNSLWALVAVALIAFVLTEAYRRNAERRFSDLLTANLYILMGTVEPGGDGTLSGQPDLRDSRYLTFGSGWYWTVSSVQKPLNRIASASLAGGSITAPQGIALDSNYLRLFSYVDDRGQSISAVEGQTYLGDGQQLYSFKVTGNKAELAEEIASFRRTLVALLGLFGLGFVAATYWIVRIGLKPITAATTLLADIREGRAERLDGNFPREIQPLIDETNALIESNRSVVERARTQVGNLAHSLKTPLAVLKNEAGAAPPQLARIMQEQTSMMQQQVQNYLDRARIAARHATVTSRTEVTPVLERLVRVIGKLNSHVTIGLELADDTKLIFAGEQQDFEEIVGNLLENAARFADERIIVKAAGRKENDKQRLVLRIEDDGPGMTPQQCELAMKRGTRIDESTPGSGLGLAIVRDIASEYGGRISLGRSDLGGLGAELELPGR